MQQFSIYYVDYDHLLKNQNETPICDVSFPNVSQIQVGFCSLLCLTKNGQVYGRRRVKNELDSFFEFLYDKWTLVPTPYPIQQISFSYSHALLLSYNHQVYGFGTNHHGQLVRHIDDSIDQGIDNVQNLSYSNVNFILKQSKKVFTGINSSFILCKDDTLFACGNNGYDKLGIKGHPNVKTPMLVSFFLNKPLIKDVKIGTQFTMVLLINGNLYGMGNPCCCTNPKISDPVLISISSPIRFVHCFDFGTIVETENNQWYSFGDSGKNRIFGEEDYPKRIVCGKEFGSSIQRIDDQFPSNIQIKKFTSTKDTFFILTTNNEIYSNRCHYQQKLDTKEEEKWNLQTVGSQWNLQRTSVLDIETGWTDLVFIHVPCPFFQSFDKFSDIRINTYKI